MLSSDLLFKVVYGIFSLYVFYHIIVCGFNEKSIINLLYFSILIMLLLPFCLGYIVGSIAGSMIFMVCIGLAHVYCDDGVYIGLIYYIF